MKFKIGDFVYNSFTKKIEKIQDIIGNQYMLDYNDLYDENELEEITNEKIAYSLSRYEAMEDDFGVSKFTLHKKLIECCKIKDEIYKNLLNK